MSPITLEMGLLACQTNAIAVPATSPLHQESVPQLGKPDTAMIRIITKAAMLG